MKILIASPLKLGMSGKFLNGLVPVLRHLPYDFITVEGPCVNFARNLAAQKAVDDGYDGLVQIDEDVRWVLDHLTRLLSHADKADIVAGIYPSKGEGRTLYHPVPYEGGEPQGLMPCKWVPTGFLYTSTRALKAIRDCNTDRWFNQMEGSDEKTSPRMEWFPMGIVGEGTASARLDRIKGILSLLPRIENAKAYLPASALEKIREVVEKVEPPGRLLGEDFYFCELATRAGFIPYVDSHIVLEHAT